MEILKRQKIISIGIFVVLLIGLVVGVVLVQKQQNLKSKASQEIYNAFAVKSGDSEHFVNCSGNVCETNTLNITISVRDLQALETTSEVISQTPEQTAREDYFQTVNDDPIVDDQSQNSALSAYFKSAQDVAESEDQEYARERGLPDAAAQNVTNSLISTLEKGLDVPDELWQDYGSKLGNLSQGAVDLVTSQVQNAQERGEQKKAEEAVAEAERLAEQDEKEYLEGLEKWRNAAPSEKAQQIKTALNLPLGTPDEDALNIFNKAAEPLGINVTDQGNGNFVFELIPPTFSTPTPGISVSRSLVSTTSLDTTPFCDALEGEELSKCKKSWEDSADVMVAVTVGPAAVGAAIITAPVWIPAAGSAIAAAPAVINAGSLQLYVSVTGTGGVILSQAPPIVQKAFGFLLQRGDTIINASTLALCQASENPSACIYENYAQFPGAPVLRESADVVRGAASKVREGALDVAVSKAFDMAGATESRGGELFVDAKAALQAAKEAGKEGLEEVWVGTQRLAADERGSWDVFGLLGSEKRRVVGKIPPNVPIPESRDIDLTSELNRVLDQIRLDPPRTENGQLNITAWGERTKKELTEIFGQTGIPEHHEALMSQFDSFLTEGQRFPPGLVIDKAQQVERAFAYLELTGWRVFLDTPKDVRQVFDAWQYDSVFAKGYHERLVFPENLKPSLKAELLQAVLSQEWHTGPQDYGRVIETTQEVFDAAKVFSVANGGDPVSFARIPEVIDKRVAHFLDQDMTDIAFGRKEPGLNGFYNRGTDKNIIINRDNNSGVGSFLHESTHRAADLANPNEGSDLSKLLGWEIADRFQEGATEKFSNIGERLVGRDLGEIAFEAEVQVVDQIIAQVAKNLNISLQQAEAKFIELTVRGQRDELVRLAGPEKVAEFFRNNPTKNPERFGFTPSGVTPSEKGLAIADALEDLARTEGVKPNGNSGMIPLWNLLAKEVFAQSENIDNSVLNSASFEFLVKTKLAKRALEASGRLDNRYIKGLLEKDIFAPEIIDTPDGLSIVTGKTGNVEGEIKAGSYKVEIKGMQNLDIKVPSVVEVKTGTTIVPIGIREGSGKVEKIAGIRSRGGIDVYAEDQELAKVKVAAFYDENGNGNWDRSEKALPWAGIQVTLAKVTQEKTINLKEGWNLITLPALPSQVMTAKDLLGQIAKQGGSATAVSTLENGAWKSYVVKDHQDYSKDNFPIEPGKAYFVNALKYSTLSFTGQEFTLPVKVSLKEGWNAVGFPKTSKQFKARDLGANEDFIIEENRGYLLNLKKGVDFSP